MFTVRFFDKDVLFPYVGANLDRHLADTWHTPETQQDVAGIRIQVGTELFG